MDSCAAYLREELGGSCANLNVVTSATVSKILLDGDLATGTVRSEYF